MARIGRLFSSLFSRTRSNREEDAMFLSVAIIKKPAVTSWPVFLSIVIPLWLLAGIAVVTSQPH